jgi:hypothetical protein
LEITAEKANPVVTLKTLTPNFKSWEVQFDNGPWKTSAATFTWTLQLGTNLLAARARNQFGVAGPVSAAEIEVTKTR